jgi:CubicO group peptidase (beta-lactamase class C family)
MRTPGACEHWSRRSSDVNFGRVAGEIEAAVAAGAFPGAVVLVSQAGRVLYHAAFGARSLEPERTPMSPETIFDLSSLTKALATTTAFMVLVREKKVVLDDRVTRFFHNFGVHGKTHVTFRHLLAHCSGLAGWRPYYQDVQRIERQRLNFVASRGAKEFVYEQIHRERPEYEVGGHTVYSDLGFMLLGELIELVTRMPLDRFCHERIFRPLGLRATGFVDLTALRTRKLAPVTGMIAPTERCPWRKRVLCGEVHDDNAYAMGGVAGHAGLFSSAADVDALATRLGACWRGEDDFLPSEVVGEFWRRDATIEGSTWGLGWDTPSPSESSAGRHISRSAVGHLGFTGTSLWIDLERRANMVLLTNRVHPRRDNERIREVRPRVHDAILEALDA